MMCACTGLSLMPDGPELEILFVDAEGRFRVRQRDVDRPEILRRPVADIGAQEITALTQARPLGVLAAPAPVEHGAVAPGLELDVKESRGTTVGLEQASDAGPDLRRILGATPEAAGLEVCEALGQPLAEALVHRPFFLLPHGAAAEDERLVGAVG